MSQNLSKGLRFILALAIVLALSIMPVLQTVAPVAVEAAPPTDSGLGADFYGWNVSARTPAYPDWPGAWTKGDLGKNYSEGDWVSYVFIFTNTNKEASIALPASNIYYDFYTGTTKDAIFVDLLRNFSYKVRAN